MSKTGRVLGYLMAAYGLILILPLALTPNGGGHATAGAILICTVWLGRFVFNREERNQ
jgi:hypothetical protein